MANGHFVPTRTILRDQGNGRREAHQKVPPTVFIVDDDAGLRESLAYMLRSNGFDVGAYDTAEAFLGGFDAAQPGCALADVRLPGMSGIALQRVLSSRGTSLPLIIMTGYADVAMAVTALRHGAYDFIEKPVEPEKLLASVRQALAHDAELRRKRQQHEWARQRLAGLSAREREVLALVVDGAPSKVIAFDLRISQKTVEAHRASIMQKMQADSLAQLIRLGLTAQLSLTAQS